MWTQGESDSRPPDANRMHYHYAMGPKEENMRTCFMFACSTTEGHRWPQAIWGPSAAGHLGPEAAGSSIPHFDSLEKSCYDNQ